MKQNELLRNSIYSNLHYLHLNCVIYRFIQILQLNKVLKQRVDLLFQVELVLAALQMLIAYEHRLLQRVDANSDVQKFRDLQ